MVSLIKIELVLYYNRQYFCGQNIAEEQDISVYAVIHLCFQLLMVYIRCRARKACDMDVVFTIISLNISCQQLWFLFYTKVVELFSLSVQVMVIFYKGSLILNKPKSGAFYMRSANLDCMHLYFVWCVNTARTQHNFDSFRALHNFDKS